MLLNSNLILTLLVIIPTIFASLNGICSGRNGICINTNTCSNYGGQSFVGKCPNDPNNVRCCDNIPCTVNDGRKGSCVFTRQCSGELFSGKCPGGSDFKCCVDTPKDSSYNGPCNGGGGACINIDNTSCGTYTVTGKCPGGSNIKCCVAGSEPSWYIDQYTHTETICTIKGQPKSVATSGCGISCLSMAISTLKNNYVSPETLFREGYNNGMYWGDGFSHDGLTFLGKKHGVKVSWTDNISTVFSALQSGKAVIFHVGKESKYHFTKGGHYIFLYGAKKQNGIEKVYVFDSNGFNHYVNVLFPLRKSEGGIEVAKKGTGSDFGIVERI
jgi:hypothetical protein